MKTKRLSDAQQSSLTTLPEAVMQIILCLLPIEEAARTSVLSKEWRYKWTKIPKLMFSEATVKEETLLLELEKRRKYMRCILFNAIHQVLLQRQAPIHEFTLSMIAVNTCVEIDQIILHLSRSHTLKKLTLDLGDPCYHRSYCLPSSVFSLHHLTDLYLKYCNVNLKQIPSALGSLTSLTLNRTWIPRETLVPLLSNCPSLKSLCIMLHNDLHDDDNLSILELFKCLPMIEHLTTWGHITLLLDDGMPEGVTASLINLKYFCIEDLCFGHGNGLAFLGLLTKCAPNLEKIKLEIETDDGCDELRPDKLEADSLILEKYSDVYLEHLNELEISCYRNSKLELVFVKFILARSPNLKKVIFLRISMIDWEMILKAPRASPAEIVVVHSDPMITLKFV